MVAEEAARALDHLAGADVVAALVPRADEAAVGVHGPLGQVGELVPAPAGHGEVPVLAVGPGPRLPTAQSPTRRTAPGGRSAAGIRSSSGTGTPRRGGGPAAGPYPARRPPDPSRRRYCRSVDPCRGGRAPAVRGPGRLRPARRRSRPGPGRGAVPAGRADRRRGRRALGAEANDVGRAVEELQTEDGIQLFVVFVDSFEPAHGGRLDRRTRMPCPDSAATTPCSPSRWRNGSTASSVPDGADVTRAEMETLAGQAVEPEFAEGDWAAGAVAFADILRTGEAPGSGGLRWRRRAAAAGRDRRRRWRRLPGRAATGGGSAPPCRRRCSGWRSPTRTPARPRSSCSSAPAPRCWSWTRR